MVIINPSPAPPFGGQAYTHITPFTYRDGATYLEVLESLRKYIRDILVTHIDDSFDAIEDYVNKAVAAIEIEVNNDIAELTEKVNDAIQSIINNSITVQDPVVAQLLNDPESETRVEADQIFANKVTQETVENGRLSPSGIQKSIEDSTGINILNYGAARSTTTNLVDSWEAMQNAINDCKPGQKVIFPYTGSGEFWYTSKQLVINTPSITLEGSPRDGYAVSIRTNTPNLTMIAQYAPGVTYRDIGFIGKTDLNGGWINGENCTAVGVEVFGDTDGNMDTLFTRATFQYMMTAVNLHGRNCAFRNTLFSNVRFGVRHTGITPFHTGPNADQNRGTSIVDCRFHNIGFTSTDKGIEFTPASKVIHLIVNNNHFDSGGKGKHISIKGDAATAARGVTLIGNKHTETPVEAYELDYCHYPLLSDFVIMGALGGNAHAITLSNCLYPVVDNFLIRLIGGDGIRGVSNSDVMVSNGRIFQVGQGTVVGNALTFDSTNTDVNVDNVHGATGDGWFFSGSPVANVGGIRNCTYKAFTLGGIDSLTMNNVSSRGLNTYVESSKGKLEDVGRAQYNLVANTAKRIATISIGNSFGAFILEVDVAGRHSISTQAFYSGKRAVYVENGTPVFNTIGADAATGLTISYVFINATTVGVNVLCTSDIKVGASVKAMCPGGATATISTDLTVNMVAQ